MSQNMIGRVIKNRFEVEAFVAAGGMKTVYRVLDRERSVPLAMKVLHSNLEEDQAVMRSFRRDAKAIEKLAHPNIVRFYGMEKSGSLFFLLEAYIQGPSLKELLKDHKPFPIEEALIYFKALCAALGFAHANSVVHCDVKPANVMVDQGGNILLTDFGIARHADSDSTSTLAGAGTPGYMAPEQVRGDAVTAATDIYALGILLFEMLTGQRPFLGTEPELATAGSTLNERVRYAQVVMRPPNPRKINQNISSEVAGVILKALEKDPGDRFSTVQEFLWAACEAAGTSLEEIPDRVQTLASNHIENLVPLKPQPPARWKRVLAFFQQTWKMVWPSKWPYFAVGGVLAIILAFNIFRPVIISPPPQPMSTAFITMKPMSIMTGTLDITATITAKLSPSTTSTQTPTITPTEDPPPPIDWSFEVIDSTQQVGVFSALVISQKGTRFAAYLDDKEPNNDLKFASDASGRWKPKTIVGESKRDGWYPEMSFDSKGILHLSYFAYDARQLKYGSMSGSEVWSFPDIVAQNVKILDQELAIGSDDIPQIVFCDDNTKRIYYTKKTKNEWSTPKVIANSPANASKFNGGLVGLGIDSRNQPHVVFLGDSGTLWYASLSGDQWSTPVPIDQSAGSYPTLVFDSQGKPHLSYYDWSNGALKYAYLENQNWQTIIVDNLSNVGQFSSIAVDTNENVHIGYYDVGRNHLKYARSHTDPRQPNNWYRYTVDGKDDVGSWVSLALDKNGNPTISYYDSASEILMLAYGKLPPGK